MTKPSDYGIAISRNTLPKCLSFWETLLASVPGRCPMCLLRAPAHEKPPHHGLLHELPHLNLTNITQKPNGRLTEPKGGQLLEFHLLDPDPFRGSAMIVVSEVSRNTIETMLPCVYTCYRPLTVPACFHLADTRQQHLADPAHDHLERSGNFVGSEILLEKRIKPSNNERCLSVFRFIFKAHCINKSTSSLIASTADRNHP